VARAEDWATQFSATIGLLQANQGRAEGGTPDRDNAPPWPIVFMLMKHHKFSPAHNPEHAGASPAHAVENANQSQTDFSPSPEAVARKAYFAYVNEGSRPGHEVQHWLAAEAELIAERNLTRAHGFHNQT